MKKQATTTTAIVLNRYFIKRNGHVVYKVLSSDGVTQYTCTLVAGLATGCDCKSRKPCKHMKAAEQKEATRTPAQEQEPVVVAAVVPAQVAVVATGAVSTPEQRATASLNGSRAFSLMR